MNLNNKAVDIEAAAAAWFEKREWSGWDAAAEQALQAWLSESTAHRVAFLRLEAAWERAERLKVLGAGVPAGRVPDRASFGFADEKSADLQNESPPKSPLLVPAKGKSGRFGWAIGAASAAAAVIIVVWYHSVAQWQMYGTPVGTIAPVALADGSRITLDSNTQIQVAFGTDRRLIRLDKGKALFEVAKDTSRPMVVEVADKRVTAVGTEFLVQRDAQDVTVRARGRRQGIFSRG
jgi:transmembrane sensor